MNSTTLLSGALGAGTPRPTRPASAADAYGRSGPGSARKTSLLASYQCFPFAYTYYGICTEACSYETPVSAPAGRGN